MMAEYAKQFYTVSEVAAILSVSRDTVIRKFYTYPGVIDLGTKEEMHKRKYRVLRIPVDLLEKFLSTKQVK